MQKCSLFYLEDVNFQYIGACPILAALPTGTSVYDFLVM